MNQKVRFVARYGGVMLRRSWEFRVFAVISVLLIIFLQYLLQGDSGMAWHHISLPASVPWLNTYFFNIAQSFMFVLVIGEVMARDKHSDTSQGSFDIHPDYFLPAAGEIIVDNEDPFFFMSETIGHQRLTLTSGAKQKKYGIFVDARTNKWIPIIDDNCYGDHIASAYVRLRERKGSIVSWIASIPEADRYELWVYTPWIMPMTDSSAEEAMQYYVVRDEGGEREIGINVLKDTRWVFLDGCELPEGENRVTLLDKGTEGQCLMADAIKWVRVKMD